MNSDTNKEFSMRLSVCSKCPHGSEVDGKSYCGEEDVYSYLTQCIQKIALEYYLKREGIEERCSNKTK